MDNAKVSESDPLKFYIFTAERKWELKCASNSAAIQWQETILRLKGVDR